MLQPHFIIPLALCLVSLASVLLLYRNLADRRRLRATQHALDVLNDRFAPVLDAEYEKEKILLEVENLTHSFNELKASYEKQFNHTKEEILSELETLRNSYSEKKRLFDRLAREVAIFDERLAFAELGIYEPHFDFNDSEDYKREILSVRNAQKEMIIQKGAVLCETSWSVNGSESKGQTMANRAIRLTLRAFNNECDAAIANTRWNNALAMEKRILRAREQIEKLNGSLHIVISDTYTQLKLKELHLTHEHREKIKFEREERAEDARLQREEQRLLREIEDAERQEESYSRLLEKAKAEAAGIAGERLDAFKEQIQILERQLQEAHSNAERAKAMAEKTKSGYVYIISNVGSLGEGVVKIGLTRRLDPLERVRELGDASVPFIFDTHAIIYSEDAPQLEKALHVQFDSKRINTQNYRKEFFRVSLEEVEVAVKQLSPDAPFFRDIEAQEYRETLYKRQLVLQTSEVEIGNSFPSEI